MPGASGSQRTTGNDALSHSRGRRTAAPPWPPRSSLSRRPTARGRRCASATTTAGSTCSARALHEGAYVAACGRKFHVDHFACSVCPRVFRPHDRSTTRGSSRRAAPGAMTLSSSSISRSAGLRATSAGTPSATRSGRPGPPRRRPALRESTERCALKQPRNRNFLHLSSFRTRRASSPLSARTLSLLLSRPSPSLVPTELVLPRY